MKENPYLVTMMAAKLALQDSKSVFIPKSLPTKLVQDLEISDDIHDMEPVSLRSENSIIYYYCEFSYEGKSYEGVIEAVRVWDEGEQYASVEWASDTISNVKEIACA